MIDFARSKLSYTGGTSRRPCKIVTFPVSGPPGESRLISFSRLDDVPLRVREVGSRLLCLFTSQWVRSLLPWLDDCK